MIATRTYLTGGLGSRHRDEAFGEPFELPPDRAYTETCAAIASVMLGLATAPGHRRARVRRSIERTMYNAVLPGRVARRDDVLLRESAAATDEGASPVEPGDGARAPMVPVRLLPTEPHAHRSARGSRYIATGERRRDPALHQYATASVAADVPGGMARLAIETDYPWDWARRDHRGGVADAALDPVAPGAGLVSNGIAGRAG